MKQYHEKYKGTAIREKRSNNQRENDAEEDNFNRKKYKFSEEVL